MSDACDVQMQWDVKIPLRDGVRLSAILYLPRRRTDRAPTLFTMTPYVAQSHHEQGVYFASHGYPFLSVDVRGRGNSEGVFHPLNDAADGHDVVEWLATQDYCDGRVAMWGLSYLGHCQWVTAAERPPHLATIVPVASPFHGVDVPLRNNVATPYTIQWITMLCGRTAQDKLGGDHLFWARTFRQWFEAGVSFQRLDSFVGNTSALFQEWLSHPHRDDYWDRYNPTARTYSSITLPILTITGAYDGDQLGAIEHYKRHLESAPVAARERHYLVIGPWDHSGTRAPKAEFCGLKVGPASLIDIPKLHLQWYEWTMRGGLRPEFLRKKVAFYVTGAEKWCYADTLEEVTAHFDPLYLDSDSNPTDVLKSGALSRETPVRDREDWYVYDPRDVSHAAMECTIDSESLVDQRMVYASTGKHLVYHSACFADERQISGFFKLVLWLGIDQPDTDFRAAVYEVSPDGGALLLSVDWIRARYRESLRTAVVVAAAEPLCYRFEHFPFVARLLRRGSRLRLVVGPINSIYWEKNYNGGGTVAHESAEDGRPVTVRLFHGPQHASALFVPFGAEDSTDGLA